jgi:hypothetical protein
MKRRVWLSALLFAGLAGLLWIVLASRQTTYQGKTLPQWASQFHTNRWPLDKQAEAAIKHFGTNAIPVLLEMMLRQQKPYRIWLGAHAPKKWLTWFRISSGQEYKDEIDAGRSAAAAAFKALGDAAGPAVPGLIGLLHHKDQRIRYLAVFALRTLGPITKPALPDLIECLKDPEFTIRDDAVISMGTIHAEPERVVPIVMEFLEKYRANVILCSDAIGALGAFGADARQAVPMLVPFLSDSRPSISSAATNAITLIDPEAIGRSNPPIPTGPR